MKTKRKIINSLIWAFLERIGAQGVSFIVSIVLARLLFPKEFGVIAIVTIFISLANTFVTAGLGNSLIQKKNADDIDFSTVFYFNIFFSLIVYIVLWLIAPVVSNYFEMYQLTIIIRVMGIRVLFSAVNSVQRAFVSRNFLFKKFFFSTIIGTLFSAIIGIYMAYNGYGVWALVAQYMTNSFIDTFVLWITVKWRPKKVFSLSRLKTLFSFGWKLLLSSLLSTIYVNIYSIIIGKFYSSSDLAFYNRGKKFPQIFSVNISSAIDSVFFPAMASQQDNIPKLKIYARKSISFGSFIIFPIMFGLAAIADNMIPVLLTDKWNDAIIFVQIASISFAFLPITMANLQVIKALGRSDTYLKLDIIKKIVGLSILFSLFKRGVVAIAIAEALSTFLGLFINTYHNKKYINYSLYEQIKDIFPSLLSSMIMAIIVFLIGEILVFNVIIVMFIQVVSGAIIYLIITMILRLSVLSEIIEMIKSYKTDNV